MLILIGLILISTFFLHLVIGLFLLCFHLCNKCFIYFGFYIVTFSLYVPQPPQYLCFYIIPLIRPIFSVLKSYCNFLLAFLIHVFPQFFINFSRPVPLLIPLPHSWFTAYVNYEPYDSIPDHQLSLHFFINIWVSCKYNPQIVVCFYFFESVNSSLFVIRYWVF